ncbi:MAG: PilZ domain-containing protein, partial [Deltaproteobacteria bacterium]|nr:PilZ domain-containing protein [Deltaproteobacteria bacterium]
MSRIPVSQIVNDIRSGMSDGELRTRYKLSTKGLHRLLRILVYEKAISHDELYERSHAYRSVSDLLASRHSPRIYVPIPLRILSKGESESGFVRDMSETGVRVAGMNAKVGDIMTLCLPLNQLPITRSIEFDAVCRWSRIEGKNRKYLVTGFEIIDISEEAQKSFIDLIVFFQSQGKAELRWLYGSLDETDLSESQREAVAAEELSPEFSGTVHGVDILDFVQFLMLTGKRTLLHVRSSTGDECELHVDHGKITHAVHGVKEGHEAFFECMNFPGGVFFTEPWR